MQLSLSQGTRKPYKPGSGPSMASKPDSRSDSEEVHLALDDWDEWFKSPESD